MPHWAPSRPGPGRPAWRPSPLEDSLAARSAKAIKPYTAEVREEAIRRFREEHVALSLPPVVVVIAALDEEESLGGVLEGIAPEACGLEVGTLVVDDGSTDRTSDVARDHSVQVARLQRNCGHGIALRVGYQLAREYGARYIVTLDADGQWDPAEIEDVLEPLAAGEADFVIGSRVLGRAETDDALRQAGVHVFARLVQLLTGVPVTDTSSGFRDARGRDGHGAPDAGPVPDVRAAAGRDRPRLPHRRAPDRHAQADGRREQ